MLYKKNNAPKLSQELFENPTSEYRGTPFWGWNCELKREELEWQLENFKKMGFGGAHMHVRTGMSTPYLSDEFMDLIKACVEKAKSENMLAWLYDEDRWPSGAAGGLVTKEKKYRGRYLLFTPTPYQKAEEETICDQGTSAGAGRAENGTLLCCYDVHLNKRGYLLDWKVIGEEEAAVHEKWYAYLELMAPSPWYNNQAYVNTLDKAAMDRFIEITYEAYNRTISDEFGKAVPAIFTDEPQFVRKTTLKFATEKADVVLPWTDDLPETFGAVYGGEDLLAGVPELIWDRADGSVSALRYHYHDHVCERFTKAFADNCGTWCREHGLALTGHMMNEQTLRSQTNALGEAMRAYRGFDLPGVDMIYGRMEYNTVKQAQSAAHQYDREGLLSELYGVTDWDFDFRDYKFHGDWQTALGVTVRVPHLSWVSMGGEAKRDCPASINYHSPWWEKYHLVEDYFARAATALTRGKPLVRVGVIHPIESFWLHFGPAEQTALIREQLDENFKNITEWLLFGGIDFDFISESLLPDLCGEGTAPLKVGAMEYDVVLVPGCETLRSTTLERLEAFAAAGGRLIFVGEAPALTDALPGKRGAALAERTELISWSRFALLQALEPVRMVEIRNGAGALTDNLLCNLRQDGAGRWLFVACGKNIYNKDMPGFQDLRIRLAGRFKAVVYDTANGGTKEVEQCLKGNATEISYRLYDYDSLLLWLEPVDEKLSCGAKDVSSAKGQTLGDTGKISWGKTADQARKVPTEIAGEAKGARTLPVPSTVPYTLSEPNALLLDQAEYALDEALWAECDGQVVTEEILRLDDACRVHLGWQSRRTSMAQPWAVEEEPITHTIHLRFRIQSEIAYEGALLAIEEAEKLKLKWNGKEIDNTVIGWYADKAIKTVALPTIEVGENVLEADIPFGKRTAVEWAYLLGDFGVEISGRSTRIVAARKELSFDSITTQGLPFYTGNITYHIPVETGGGQVTVKSKRYRGSLQTIAMDGGKEIPMIASPYEVSMGEPDAGRHTVDITLYGHRRNGFGPLHLANPKDRDVGPFAWRSDGDRWTYDYMLCEVGVLNTPVITEI
ncbi:MAG: hypothetical protein E7286_06075 [Lachnospiraceae bacterium]|nr:hypothetical protein [Lachnospiraceae bacterium]